MFPTPAGNVDQDIFQPSAQVMEMIVSASAEAAERVEGFDTSHWERIDWYTLIHQTNLEFAIFKATQGTTIVDVTFAFNKSECQKYGYPWAGYHFYVPGDPIAQARHYVNTVGGGCDVYVCDVETAIANMAIESMRTKNARLKIGGVAVGKPNYPVFRLGAQAEDDVVAVQYKVDPAVIKQYRAELAIAYLKAMGTAALTLAQQVDAFLQEVKRLKPNAKLVIYTSPYFCNTFLKPPAAFAKYILWIAHVTEKPEPLVPYPWSFWTLWQWTFSLFVPGAQGALDGDRWYSDLIAMQAFFGNANPPPVVVYNHLDALTLVEGQNIRSGPGIGYTIIGTLHAGEIVHIGNVVGPAEYWAKLYDDSHNLIGWASIKYAAKLYLDIRE